MYEEKHLPQTDREQTVFEARMAEAQQISAELASCLSSLDDVLDRLEGTGNQAVGRELEAPTPVPNGQLDTLRQTQSVTLASIETLRSQLGRLSSLV